MSVMEIPLTQGKVALVDAEDYQYLSKWKWHAVKSRRTYYATRGEGPRNAQLTVRMHRVLLNAPHGTECDHRNGNGLDNRRNNLRLATRQQNIRNKRNSKVGKTSRFLGVCRFGRSLRWKAQIAIGKPGRDGYARTESLGTFATEEEAALAYDAAARLHFGEFAALNFEEGGGSIEADRYTADSSGPEIPAPPQSKEPRGSAAAQEDNRERN